MTGREKILQVGQKLYGEEFNLEEEVRRNSYRIVFEILRNGLDSEKESLGAMIIGPIGVGKTALMRVMQKLFMETSRAFKTLDCREIPVLMEYFKVHEIMEMYGQNLKMDLYMDDIGIGEAVYNKFGNTTNMISEIIMSRYNLFIAEGYKTHISSNKPTFLDPEKYPDIITLTKIYGDRTVDRLREMCTLVTFEGKSLRQLQHAN